VISKCLSSLRRRRANSRLITIVGKLFTYPVWQRRCGTSSILTARPRSKSTPPPHSIRCFFGAVFSAGGNTIVPSQKVCNWRQICRFFEDVVLYHALAMRVICAYSNYASTLIFKIGLESFRRYAHSMRMKRNNSVEPRSRKRFRHRAIRINITLPPVLAPVLDKIIADKGFSGPVDYFKNRIRLDGQLTLRLDEQASS